MTLGFRAPSLIALCATCLLGSGCPADDGDDVASTTAPDPSSGADPQTTSGPEPQTTGGPEPATTTGGPEPATTTGEPEPTQGNESDSTGGAPLDCEDATRS